mgnify:FL=1
MRSTGSAGAPRRAERIDSNFLSSRAALPPLPTTLPHPPTMQPFTLTPITPIEPPPQTRADMSTHAPIERGMPRRRSSVRRPSMSIDKMGKMTMSTAPKPGEDFNVVFIGAGGIK